MQIHKNKHEVTFEYMNGNVRTFAIYPRTIWEELATQQDLTDEELARILIQMDIED